ncbi:MAG TPA: response regulator [Candidatus Omnitrophota bacterium]|nr:response regulator [Candidatus Omnitrophota bacterium]
MAKIKVLSIDDDRSTTRLNESLLTQAGYEVHIASNGFDGIKKAEEVIPDVILLDLILPGEYGYEVCKQLNQNKQTKDIPIIIVTGSGLEEVAMNEPGIKASGYIPKPYGAEDLISAIEKALRKK